MKFKGTFTTIDPNIKYNIQIGNIGTDCIITDPINFDEDQLSSTGPVVMFDSSPVNIICSREDLTKRIIISQATINLISKGDLSPYLYADTNISIPVTITKGTGANPTFIWFGYVDPLQFSQGYAHNYESVQVTATDPLGRLEEITVDDIIINGTGNYVTRETEMTPWNCIISILKTIGLSNGIGHERINSTVKSAMQNTKIKMTVFFGDDEDDYKTCYDILENICNYFNLYIALYNSTSASLSCETKSSIDVSNLAGNAVNISLHTYASDDSTSISQDDVYSQIKLKCNIEPVKDIFTALDDKDFTYSDYNNYEKYMTEWESPGESLNSWKDFNQILNDHPENVVYDDVWSVDHYVYVLRNDKWDFGSNSYINYLGGSIDYTTGTKTPCTIGQMNVMKWLHDNKFRCAYLGLAKSNKIYTAGNVKDNSVQDNLSLKKYLVISTLGNYDNSQYSLDSYSTALQPLYSTPLCTFRGYENNIISPADTKVTNYIVISGNIILNPLPQLCGQWWGGDADRSTNTWNDAKSYYIWNTNGNSVFMPSGYHRSVLGAEGGWCYYQQRWLFDNNGTVGYDDDILGVYGPLGRKSQYAFTYEYSEGGVAYDKISKMPIICCKLKVGDKYCVERLDLGTPNVFQWMTQAEIDDVHLSGGETLSPTFTIGIDPKIDDEIIGPSYQIAKSTTLEMNIDKSGMAIPVKASDELSGTVEFSILGPYNATWQKVCKYNHGWWFWKHSITESATKSILANTQSIMLEGLKIELTSDNAGVNDNKTTADNDLVYASNMNRTYNEEQELEIDICTAPTFDECQEWGIKYQTSNSYIYNTNNSPFAGYGGTIKPEECIVDYMYKEYGSPTKILETQLKATQFVNGQNGIQMNEEILNKYYSNVFKKTNPNDPDIYAMLSSYNIDLKYQTIDTKFREFKTVFNTQL